MVRYFAQREEGGDCLEFLDQNLRREFNNDLRVMILIYSRNLSF